MFDKNFFKTGAGHKCVYEMEDKLQTFLFEAMNDVLYCRIEMTLNEILWKHEVDAYVDRKDFTTVPERNQLFVFPLVLRDRITKEIVCVLRVESE